MIKSIENKKCEYRKIQGLIGDASLSIILPKEYANRLEFRKGDFVKIYQDSNKIIIERA